MLFRTAALGCTELYIATTRRTAVNLPSSIQSKCSVGWHSSQDWCTIDVWLKLRILYHSKGQRRCRGIWLQGTILHLNASPLCHSSTKWGFAAYLHCRVISVPHFSQFYSDVFLNPDTQGRWFIENRTLAALNQALWSSVASRISVFPLVFKLCPLV